MAGMRHSADACMLCCRKIPGTLPAGAGARMGLIDKEITAAVSDVEGSTALWEA